jgi:hypothetical protein
MRPTMKELVAQVEQLSSNDQKIEYKLHADYGSDIAIIQLNPKFGEHKQKKYLLGWRKDVDGSRLTPLLSSDKAKDVAGWVSDRLGF